MDYDYLIKELDALLLRCFPMIEESSVIPSEYSMDGKTIVIQLRIK